MPHHPSPRQLQYLIALSETLHFGEAAKRCNVSQPTLSTQIRLLEDRLGAALVERGASFVELTPAGMELLPMARRCIQLLDDMIDMANQGTNNLGGLIRLGVAPTFGPYILPFMLPHLHALYPDLKVYVREERPVFLQGAILDGKLDCMLSPMPISDPRIACAPICKEQILVGLPREHTASGKRSLSVSDLAGERLLTLGRGHRLIEQVQELAEKSGAIIQEDYEGTSLDALRQMVSIGMGLSLFPAAYILSEFDKEHNVVLRSIDGYPIERTICLAWFKASLRTDHFKAFAEEARNAVTKLSGKSNSNIRIVRAA
jgi:LysR family transcriptional regulator, hydrogen peroxide-inducible genes activator